MIEITADLIGTGRERSCYVQLSTCAKAIKIQLVNPIGKPGAKSDLTRSLQNADCAMRTCPAVTAIATLILAAVSSST